MTTPTSEDTQLEPRIPMEYIAKFNGNDTPAIYDLDIEHFKSKTFVRKIPNQGEYVYDSYEVGNRANNITIWASLDSKTEAEALLEIYEELRTSVVYYKNSALTNNEHKPKSRSF